MIQQPSNALATPASNRVPLNNLTNTGARTAQRKSLAPGAKISIAQPPSTRKSSIGTSISSVQRNSLSTTGRKSSIGPLKSRFSVAPKGLGTRNDPRPVTDKSFITQCIQKLTRFLVSHSYDRQLSSKVLSSPSAKEFQSILQFLFQHIDPFYSVEKIEEDVPYIFRTLRYPFQFSKRSLTSVGTPHTWPPLLAALTWFVELLCYEEAVDDASANTTSLTASLNDFDKEQDEAKIFFNFVCKAYTDFLDGQDDFAVIEKDLSATFEAKNSLIRKEMERLTALNVKLTSEIQAFVNSPDPVDHLEDSKKLVLNEIDKFSNFIKSLDEHKAMVESKLTELHHQNEIHDAELEATLREKSGLQAIVNQQAVNAVELERLCAEKASLEEHLQVHSTQRETLEKLIYDREIQISKKLEEIERLVRSFNSTAEKHDLIPANAKHAANKNYQLAFNVHAPDSLVDQVRSIVKPGLKALQDEFTKDSVMFQNEILNDQEKIRKMEETASDLGEVIGEMDNKVQQLEQGYITARDHLKDQLDMKKQETVAVNQLITNLKAVSAESVTKCRATVTHLRNDYEKMIESMAFERKQVEMILMSSLDDVISHKQFLSENIQGLEKYYLQIKTKYSSDDQLML